MLKLSPPLIKHSFFSEPSKDLPWLRIGTPSSCSRASSSPRWGKTSCPSKQTTLIRGSTRPPASSYSKFRAPNCIVRDRSNNFRQPYSSEVPISLLNDRILVCPAISIKAGLTAIFGKVRTRCVPYRGSPLSTALIYESLFRNRRGNGSRAALSG